MGLIAEIKSALGPLENIVSQYESVSNHKCLCPFHNEKTASFQIYPDTDKYYCFGCHRNGDVIDFLAEVRHRTTDTDFLIELAEELGIERKDDKYAKHRKVLVNVAEFWHRCLFKSEEAKDYLNARGIKPSTAKKWQLGYAPGVLHKKNHSPELFDLGLVKEGKRGNYSFFRNRLVIPITINNQIHGFGGRALGDDKAKYVNSPQHPLFHKREILFGLDKATILDETLVIVEGYFDVITLHQAGFVNTVCVMGTALTKEQLNMVASRNIKRIVLAYDSDLAGAKATWTSAKIIAQYLPTVHIAAIFRPERDPLYGYDPDELVLQSPDLWKTLVEMAQPVWQVHIDYILSFFPNMKSEQKQEALIRILGFTNSLNSFMASEAKKYLSEQSGYSLRVLSGIEPTLTKRRGIEPKPAARPINTNVSPVIQTTLNAIDRYPRAADNVNERLKAAGLRPIGRMDFGRFWNNRNEISATAEKFEDPETAIWTNVILLRKERVPRLLNRDKTNENLLQEWGRLMKL